MFEAIFPALMIFGGLACVFISVLYAIQYSYRDDKGELGIETGPLIFVMAMLMMSGFLFSTGISVVVTFTRVTCQ